MSHWLHPVEMKRHTQDGCQLAAIMKNAPPRKAIKAIDVGCGDGIIIFEMLRLHKATEAVGIDILSGAIKAAEHNLAESLSQNKVSLHKISASNFFRNKKHWDSYDRFVINPPFFSSGSGTENKKSLDQVARHEGSLSLKIWAKGAGKLLKTGGELYCVFPSERLAECFNVLSSSGVEPKELWWLKADKRKRRFFLRAVRGGRPGL
jgi:tRNA1Val (adenine37-N6)-methyltransferase